MSTAARCVVMAVAAGLYGSTAVLHAQDIPLDLRAGLPMLSLIGQAKMQFFGFDVYQASLWVPSGFVESAYEHSNFVLELSYLRPFKATDIAKRSTAEMLRQGTFTLEQLASWEAQMRLIFPDVKPGDRITGINHPHVGATFLANGRWVGELRDPVFSKHFFGIWLSSRTSEPQIRQALLAQRKARANASSP